MKDTIIKFETAKLAKEKGFHESIGANGSMYDIKGNIIPLGAQARLIEEIFCAAPNQSLLQKWLREEHHIHICVEYDIGRFKASAARIRGGFIIRLSLAMPSYEGALEAILQESLNLL